MQGEAVTTAAVRLVRKCNATLYYTIPEKGVIINEFNVIVLRIRVGFRLWQTFSFFIFYFDFGAGRYMIF